jgi:hypothetical protein
MEKTITLDWDSTKELKKYITLLQKRRKFILRELGYDQIHFNGSKHNLSSLLPAFNKMYDTDLTDLYESVDNSERSFYVYLHCNPLKQLNVRHDIKHLFLASKFPNLTHEPFYVGKGKGERYLDFNRNDSYRKIRSNLKKYDKEIISIKVLENLTDRKSLSYESKLIDILGLRCYSQFCSLVNLDEGHNFEERRLKYNDEMATRIMKRNGFKV